MMLIFINILVLAFLYCSDVSLAEENVCTGFCSSLGMLQSSPGKDCNDIYQINKATRGNSGLYWIGNTTDSFQVFCDMDLQCGEGGWMRVVDLDTARGDDCPTGWAKDTTDNPDIDVCRSPNDNAGCHSTFFPVNGTSYHKICGQARGYQKGSTYAFSLINEAATSIDGSYGDSLSITIGSPRKHVWTYAVGWWDNGGCPCSPIKHLPPSFVKSHYYCESGNPSAGNKYYIGDPLWDGSGCQNPDNNCCSYTGQPWFTRQFALAQHDFIEVRLCTDEGFGNEGVAIDQLQLYVQ